MYLLIIARQKTRSVIETFDLFESDGGVWTSKSFLLWRGCGSLKLSDSDSMMGLECSTSTMSRKVLSWLSEIITACWNNLLLILQLKLLNVITDNVINCLIGSDWENSKYLFLCLSRFDYYNHSVNVTDLSLLPKWLM